MDESAMSTDTTCAGRPIEWSGLLLLPDYCHLMLANNMICTAAQSKRVLCHKLSCEIGYDIFHLNGRTIGLSP